jgi:hypothetical protein
MTDQQVAIEAERHVLSAMMHGGAEEATRHLAPGDFYEIRNAKLYDHLLELWGAGVPTEPGALLHRLAETGDLTRPDTAAYLHGIQELGTSPMQVGFYAKIVLSEARRRQLSVLAAQFDAAARMDDSMAREARVAELVAGAGEGPSGRETAHLRKLRAALVDSAGLDGIPDPDPLIGEDILFRDCLAWMVGKPGCGKSFTALDMAGCVATGETWQGYPVTDGPVLYLVAEGVRGVKKRVRAWEASMGTQMTGVHFLPVPVQSKNAAQWDAFVELARELQPVLVVIDTQARVTVGVEENSNAEMGEFVHQAERLRTASSACVLIVHHIGRNGDTGRGATTLDGALSTVIKVTKDDDRVRLECQKNKDGVEWEPIDLRAVPAGESLVLMVDDGMHPPRPDDATSRKWVRDWWAMHEDEPVSIATLVETGVVSKSTFHRDKLALLKAGLVDREGKGGATRYKLSHDPSQSESQSPTPKGRWDSGTHAHSDSHGDPGTPTGLWDSGEEA